MEVLIEQYPAFLLILTRITSFMVTMPLFSYRTIPNRLKLGLSFFLAMIITMTLNVPSVELNSMFILLIIKEVLIGLLIGVAAYMIISAVQLAGSFIDFQMGFAIANVIDPQTGVQSPIIGQLFNIMALLIMLSTNAHHLLINGILNSFQYIPIDQLFIQLSNGQVAETIIIAFQNMFLIALQMALPIVGSLFLVDIAIGIVARTVPQLNVFVVGLPLKMGVSFLMIFLLFSALFMTIHELIQYMIEVIKKLIFVLGEQR